MKTAPKVTIIVAAVAAVAVIGVVAIRPTLNRRDAVHYITRPVGYSDITAAVSETGTVNPVNTVSVGSEVSGTIRTLGADFNSRVKKDQILVTLDPTDYQAAVDSSTANLHLAEANLNSAQVNVGKMKALLDMADLTLRRDTELFNKGLINQNQVDTDTTARTTSYQDYLGSQASVQVADAQVAVAKGQLAQAEFNLSKTIIRSPMDGIVLARNVSIGQTVAASLQTPTLFSLATNLTDMQVDTSVDEADAGSVKAGASATFTVTAYPNEVFTGIVSQVRINPTIVQNVVTYDAVVTVHDSSGRLLPGMTAQVTIGVGTRTHVPSVPIAGVLYRPLPAAGGGGGGFGAGAFQSSGAAPGAQAVAGAPGSQVTVWVLQNNRPVPRRVVIGLSDSTSVEIASGPLNPGDPVIVAQRRGSAGSAVAAGPNGTNGTNGTNASGSGAGGSGATRASTGSASAGNASAETGAAMNSSAPANGSGGPAMNAGGTSAPSAAAGAANGAAGSSSKATRKRTGTPPAGRTPPVQAEGLASDTAQVQTP